MKFLKTIIQIYFFLVIQIILNYQQLDELRSNNKNLIISHWNEDPLMPRLKFSQKNIDKYKPYVAIVDHNFITTIHQF